MSAIPTPPAPASPPSPPGGFRVGRLVAGILIVLLGVAWLLEVLDLVSISWDAVLPVALIVIGVGLVVAARLPEGHGWLVALGVVLTVFLTIGTVVRVPLEGGVGDRTYRPETLSDRTYELAIGNLTLDLTGSAIPQPTPPRVAIDARVGIGELVVVVPSEVRSVEVHAEAGMGETNVFGVSQGGLDVDYRVSGDQDGVPLLVLDLSVGIGEVEVRYG